VYSCIGKSFTTGSPLEFAKLSKKGTNSFEKNIFENVIGITGQGRFAISFFPSKLKGNRVHCNLRAGAPLALGHTRPVAM
jgi:hypothetical protein